MKKLNETELEAVAGGFPVAALPLAAFLLPQPEPKPSDETAPADGAE